MQRFMAEASEAAVVRTAGRVLILIGTLTVAISMLWNVAGDHPAVGDLSLISGRVTARESKTVRSRTSIEQWLIVDVTRDGQAERWVFPEFSPSLEAVLSEIPLGLEVEAAALPEPQRLRWAPDSPVRIIWSLSASSRPLVGYDQVIDALDEARYQSPLAGWITVALGLLLIGVSRLHARRAQELHTSS